MRLGRRGLRRRGRRIDGRRYLFFFLLFFLLFFYFRFVLKISREIYGISIDELTGFNPLGLSLPVTSHTSVHVAPSKMTRICRKILTLHPCLI